LDVVINIQQVNIYDRKLIIVHKDIGQVLCYIQIKVKVKNRNKEIVIIIVLVIVIRIKIDIRDIHRIL
jgi:hypothetical protein